MVVCVCGVLKRGIVEAWKCGNVWKCASAEVCKVWFVVCSVCVVECGGV